MRVERRDGKVERRVLTGMIVNTKVLSRVASKWTKQGRFASSTSNLVGGWCVDYFRKYRKAPKQVILSLYEAWADKHHERETVRMVERLLSDLSGEHTRLGKDLNVDFLLDQADEYFNQVEVNRTIEAMKGDLELGHVQAAIRKANTLGRVELATDSCVDYLNHDVSIDKDTYSGKTERLITYGGALGKFFGDELARDCFVSFEGPEKRGKTWRLLDLAYVAMTQKRKVAFFEIGDLSRRQILKRFDTRAAGWPQKARTVKWPTDLKVEKGKVKVGYEELTYKVGMTWKKARKAQQKLRKELGSGNLLKIETHPTFSISIDQIRTIVQDWQYTQDWIPDVIVIDYADILASPPGMKDSREVINYNWGTMRRVAQELHCLVVTATQSKATAYKKETIDMEDYSDDKRKRAHPSAVFALNQTEDEKELGVMRFGYVARREEESFRRFQVYTAGCLSLGNPNVISLLTKAY